MVQKCELFRLKRNYDSTQIVFFCFRDGNELVSPNVTCCYADGDRDPGHGTEVESSMRPYFYDSDTWAKTSKSTYEFSVPAFPDYTITLHLKKSGAVVPKCVLGGKECTVKTVNARFDTLAGYPKIEDVTIEGTHKKRPMQTTIDVPSDIRRQINSANWAKQKMSGAGSMLSGLF